MLAGQLASYPCTVCYNDMCGRYVTASRDLDSGEVVCRAEELFFVLDEKHRKRICACCHGRMEGAPLGCSACRRTYYCSEACRARDAPCHVWICASSRRLANAKVDVNVSVALKIMLTVAGQRSRQQGDRHDDEGDRWHGGGDEPLTAPLVNLFDELVGHALSTDDTLELRRRFRLIQHDDCDDGTPLVTFEEGIRAVERADANSFGVFVEGHLVGKACFPGASLFNHSCRPNVEASAYSPAIELRTTRAVRAGEELCICYVDEALPRSTRRALLLEQYAFECVCVRCCEEEFVRPRAFYAASVYRHREKGAKKKKKAKAKKEEEFEEDGNLELEDRAISSH